MKTCTSYSNCRNCMKHLPPACHSTCATTSGCRQQITHGSTVLKEVLKALDAKATFIESSRLGLFQWMKTVVLIWETLVSLLSCLQRSRKTFVGIPCWCDFLH